MAQRPRSGDATVPFFDSHAHLDDDRFRNDLPAVVDRALAAGVYRTVTIATPAPTSETSVAVARRFAPVWASVGIQPNHVAEASSDSWDQVVRLATKDKVVALGETGLDRHWDYTPFHAQEDYFARHLNLAR